MSGRHDRSTVGAVLSVRNYSAAVRDSKRAAWYASLEGHEVLLRLMDDELRADCGMPLVWYDVLIKVWLSPGHSIRMSELADQVLLSRSWLTRRVVQLEEAGLVERLRTGDDGRGVVARMTELGVREFRKMEDSHARSIARHFSGHLNAEEAALVRACFTRVADQGRAALRA